MLALQNKQTNKLYFRQNIFSHKESVFTSWWYNNFWAHGMWF